MMKKWLVSVYHSSFNAGDLPVDTRIIDAQTEELAWEWCFQNYVPGVVHVELKEIKDAN